MGNNRICFLTSSPVLPGTAELNPANRFVEELARRLPPACSALFVCSDPDGIDQTDAFATAVEACFQRAGFRFRSFRILDGRNRQETETLIRASDFLILAGGHVPTQNRFFAEIGLRRLLEAYEGIVMGISAGSMNSAELVYAHVEREGEAIDPAYLKFLPGLNLTKIMLLPHYQAIKDDVLDGLRVLEDVAYPDSQGRKFYALADGSYLFIHSGREELRGEAYLIADGTIRQISAEGDTVFL